MQKLFEVLGIDASPDMTADDALALIKRKLAPIMEQTKDKAVDGAIAAGKLWPDEREMARRIIAKAGLAVFLSFLEHRAPITPGAASSAGLRQGIVVSDSLQASINEQMGLKPDTFLKYNKPVRSNTFVRSRTTMKIMRFQGSEEIRAQTAGRGPN